MATIIIGLWPIYETTLFSMNVSSLAAGHTELPGDKTCRRIPPDILFHALIKAKSDQDKSPKLRAIMSYVMLHLGQRLVKLALLVCCKTLPVTISIISLHVAYSCRKWPEMMQVFHMCMHWHMREFYSCYIDELAKHCGNSVAKKLELPQLPVTYHSLIGKISMCFWNRPIIHAMEEMWWCVHDQRTDYGTGYFVWHNICLQSILQKTFMFAWYLLI